MKERESADLLSDLVLREDGGAPEAQGGLLVEPEPTPEADGFAVELERSLAQTEHDVLELQKNADEKQAKSWLLAREMVEDFQPVPWFIWRLSNYVFGMKGKTNKVTDGALIGMRRLVFAAASDPFLGAGKKVNSVHRALDILQPDVVAAVAVIHGVCRRLAACQFERIWRPILDDAILRAQIGFLVGERRADFGAGRGMLAGFAGRCGLAILVAQGELEQARKSLEMLAAGKEIHYVGLNVYGADPLQISAMTLSAAGCGRDAAFGTVRYASPVPTSESEDTEQFQWLSAFSITEMIRTGQWRNIDNRYWEALGYMVGQDRADLVQVVDPYLRRGHSLQWIV